VISLARNGFLEKPGISNENQDGKEMHEKIAASDSSIK
jgi:hypothetical protein